MAKTGRSRGPRKKRKMRRGAPILGLLLALALGAIAYGISFPLVGALEDYQPERTHPDGIEAQFNDLRDQYGSDEGPQKYVVEIIFAALLWFTMMGLGMFLVSAMLVGTDPERDAFREMPVSPADKKGMIKQMKKDLREAKRRARQNPKS